LPAEFEVIIPFFMAWKDPIVIGSSIYGSGQSEPRYTDIILAPSAMASSNVARISALEHPNLQQT
jgi:hypothetical protein